MKGPVLLHAITKKGKGIPYAEAKPIVYHGPGKFDKATGQMLPIPPSAPSYTKVFSQTLIRLARENSKVVAITAAMPEGTGLDAFRDAIPDRYFDVGLAEQHAVTFAAGDPLFRFPGLKHFNDPVLGVPSEVNIRRFALHCRNYGLDRGGGFQQAHAGRQRARAWGDLISPNNQRIRCFHSPLA